MTGQEWVRERRRRRDIEGEQNRREERGELRRGKERKMVLIYEQPVFWLWTL